MSHADRAASLNNSSGFNYRNITGGDQLSMHAFGRAIDLNPARNPYVREGRILPEGAAYDPSISGTITPTCELVSFFKRKAWVWGGDWMDKKDYMHFEK